MLLLVAWKQEPWQGILGGKTHHGSLNDILLLERVFRGAFLISQISELCLLSPPLSYTHTHTQISAK